MNNLLDDSKIKNIMNRIQSRRLELKLSYQDLASKTNMSKSTLQRYETGSIKNMPVDKLGIIATALDVSPLWLLGFDENENNNKLSNEEQQHIEDLRKLNNIGKNKVINYTKDLIEMPKYQKDNVTTIPKKEKQIWEEQVKNILCLLLAMMIILLMKKKTLWMKLLLNTKELIKNSF